MKCCESPHCARTEKFFDATFAEADLDDYHAHGPERETTFLLDAIRAEAAALSPGGLRDMTLLDIGGGVGSLHHELLKAGLRAAIDVDASHAFIEGSRREAEHQGHAERIAYRHGDFVALADEIAPADIVTLDRVVCCYPDMPRLVSLSSERARQLFGLVFPRDWAWLRASAALMRVWDRLAKGMPFWIHPTFEVDRLLRRSGFERVFHRQTFLWQAMLYRAESAPV